MLKGNQPLYLLLFSVYTSLRNSTLGSCVGDESYGLLVYLEAALPHYSRMEVSEG